MHRPCFIVVDHEFPGSISSRKLVIETAKYNVITAYSREEAVQTLLRFPEVDGVVLGSGFEVEDCAGLIAELKKVGPKLPVVLTSGDAHGGSLGADYVVPNFSPSLLLQTLQTFCGHSAETLRKHEASLDQK